jgi:hypothetical protein
MARELVSEGIRRVRKVRLQNPAATTYELNRGGFEHRHG